MPGTARRNGMREHAPLALGLLSLALTLSASSANLLSCDNGFHGAAPPAQLAQSGLECHELADGRSFATFRDGGCENAMYTAFRLSQNDGWGRGAAPEGDESGTEGGGEESTMFVPALYKRGRIATLPASASPLQKMDALTAEVVESRVVPLCSEAGGDVYVQTGVGRLNECQAGVLWSAVCCDVPDGSGSFSVGMVQEGGEVVRTVSVEELEELVGVQELFSAGCRGGGGQAEEEMMAFLTERVASSQAHSQESHASEVHEEGEEQPANGGGEEAETPSLAPALGDEPEPEVGSESEDKGNVLLYILSSVVSFLCTPFRVVASTLTKLLSQLGYVLWEDVAVLANVPGDSLILGQNLLSGVASGMEGTCDIMYRLAKMGVGSAYACMSMLGSTLLLCCQEGVLGTGMLACDVLGLVTGTLEQGWDVGVFVAGWAGQQLAEYLATVGCEMMQQTWTAGEGLGTLIWRSQRGVGHLLCMLGSIMGGVVENTVENVQEALTGQ